jgi:serine/threonine-protein kinase ATR
MLPRILSLWLDLGKLAYTKNTGQKVSKLHDSGSNAKLEKFSELHRLIKKLSERLPAWQFVTAMPQLISRICHKNPKVHQVIEAIIQGVLTLYPEQMLWHLMSVSKSTLKIRSDRINQIFSKMKVCSSFINYSV